MSELTTALGIRPAPATGRTARRWLPAVTAQAVVLAALLLIALFAHGVNMFRYPAFSLAEEEGITASRGWSMREHAQPSPYTYVYDAPPAGAIVIAGWTVLTGGYGTFGGPVNSGRALMLAVHLAMVPLLFLIVRRLGGGMVVATAATLVFSLSPLALFYQRLLLAETLAMLWLLLALLLLLDGHGRLSRVILSGVCFGVAVLTREQTLVFFPALLFIAFQQRRQHQGGFAVAGWLIPSLVVVSWYPLFALLKGELWPAASVTASGPNGYAADGVSLVQAWWFQLIRGGGGPFSTGNQFWTLVRTDWLPRDPALLIGGAAAVAVNLLRGAFILRSWPAAGKLRLAAPSQRSRQAVEAAASPAHSALGPRRALAAGLLGLMPLAYLARGGQVERFEIVIALPLLLLNLALLVEWLAGWLRPWLRIPLVAAAVTALVAGYWWSGATPALYSGRPDEPGRQALAWVQQMLPADSRMIISDSLWTSLHSGEQPFAAAHSHWKASTDPAIRTGVFADDPRNVDYLLLGADSAADITAAGATLPQQALQSAVLIARWTEERGSTRSSQAGGRFHAPQTVELWKTAQPGSTEASFLAGGYRYLINRFEHDGAYYTTDGQVTSEAQSYALLRAVWTNDRPAFDRAWDWTRTHLLTEGGTLAWLWQNGSITDRHAAADADTDTALALLMAGRRWDDPELLASGKQLAQAIWRRQVVTVNGMPYLAAGDWTVNDPVIALNPSYFSPYAFRIFAEVDPEHNWLALVDSGYNVLFAASAAGLGADVSAGLPPDWVGLERSSGRLVRLAIDKGDTTAYGYDAARTYWRLELDRRWWNDGRATAFLGLAGFLREEVERKGYVSAVYARRGDIIQPEPSLVGTTGALAALLTLDPAAAERLYAQQFVARAVWTGQGLHWSTADDIYGQAWGWFGTALYAGALPNLWRQP